MKYLIILFFCLNLYSENIEFNLNKFAELVSNQHKVNIIVDDSINEDNFSFYVQKNQNYILLPAFKKMLELKDLDLIYDKKHNFYYIIPTVKPPVEVKKPPEKNIYTIKLKSLVYDEIKLILNNFSDIKHSYIANTNSIILISTESLFNQLQEVVNLNDSVVEQFQLKITVIETNLDNSKERGTQINAFTSKSDADTQHFVNLLTMPLNAATNVFDGASHGFTASLHFLDSIGVTKIETSPVVTVQSGKDIYFSSVENIPYKTSSSSVQGASQSTQEEIQYKDVGLKISLKPILVKEIVFIDLDFVIETVLSSSDTPTTAKRQLKNSFQLKRNQLLVLSGLENIEKSTSTIGVPILMNIPYLGNMFKFNVDSETKKSLSIVIEII